ncbi:MAG: FAD-dependent thymidylate synthase [Synergistaceae bacterium]
MANFVEPKVYKIAETKLDNDSVTAWLQDLGGEECLAHVTGSDREKLIELCGRRCYKSYKEGLNPNVSRVRKDSESYHENIKKQRHGSVMEHASITFAFENVSRVVTHELVRHRAGAAYSQESLRYVRLTDINMYFPQIFSEFGQEKEDEARRLAKRAMEEAEKTQKDFMDIFKDEMESDFDVKKKLTSSFRRFAPIGLATGIIATFNFRALRHIIEMRTSRHAEEEIRLVVDQMVEFLVKDDNFSFGDYVGEDTGDGFIEYTTPYIKV